MERIKGRVWKYGDNINTDVIYPGKYLYSISDRKEMAKHALEDLDSRFLKEVKRMCEIEELVSLLIEIENTMCLGSYEKMEIMAEPVFELMNEIAPEGCIFGANLEKGSSFGFWKI